MAARDELCGQIEDFSLGKTQILVLRVQIVVVVDRVRELFQIYENHICELWVKN